MFRRRLLSRKSLRRRSPRRTSNRNVSGKLRRDLKGQLRRKGRRKSSAS